MSSEQSYYLPHGSRWPIVATIGLFTTLASTGTIMINYSAGKHDGTPWLFLAIGVAVLVFMLFGWFGKVVSESLAGLYDPQVDRSFRWGMMWFIFSEVMFFGAFFGALFYTRIFAVPWLGGEGARGISHILWEHFSATWPVLQNPDPKQFHGPHEAMSASGIALINTFLLVTSSFTVTFAHRCLKRGNRAGLKIWLATTILLGLTFLSLQSYEYHHAYTELGLKLSSGIYGSTFFILTGFHGLHVTIGAITLTVMLVRIIRGHFNAEHHFGFEAASWYWHFVDVVWICLFVFVYVL